MNRLPSFRRRCATILLRRMVLIMPAPRGNWALAMHAEAQTIADDGARLRWAVGCLGVACRQRLLASNPLRFASVRIVFSLLILHEAHALAFTAKLARTYRTHPEWSLQYLHGIDVPIYAAVPTILIGILDLSAALYGLAALALAFNRARALSLYLAALGGDVLATAALSTIAVSVDCWSGSHQFLNYTTLMIYAGCALLIRQAVRVGSLTGAHSD